jgi:hypothetical protein
MGVKYAPDPMIDAALDYVAGSNFYCVCTGSPVTFTAANATNMLLRVPVSAGSFVKADDASGRKVTMTAATSASITNSGFAEAVALVETSSSTIRYCTTCTGQQLTAGGTCDIPSWKINIQDPT